jgi:hypothetical protein
MSPNGDQIPWVTWLSGGAAALILAATAVVLLSPRPSSPAPAPGTTAAPMASTPPLAEPKDPAEPARHALDISTVLVDARTRAGLFSENAGLVGVRLIIDHARPLDPIDVSYAVTEGRPLPGAPVTSKRLRISYSAGKAAQVKETDRSPARVLPDPNCPLEAAFRAVQQAGGQNDARYFALYTHSTRHQRPTWTLTSGDGAAHHVDADNCALLVR